MFTRFLVSFLILKSSFGLDVVSTLPEFQWVVKELAPNLEVVSLLNGNEDPHFIDASPSFIFKVAKAKLIIRNGLELEDAWLEKVIDQSGNSKIANKGNCNASSKIDAIEKIANYDRSMGDVHSLGNPHFTLSPKRMLTVVETISECLRVNFPALKDIDQRSTKLVKKLQDLNKKIKAFSFSKNYYVYHREFSYLKEDYGLKILESLERIPGVLPSATYLVKVAKKSKLDKPALVIASTNASSRILKKFQEMSKVDFEKVKIHPSVGEDYVSFITKLIESIK